MYLQFVEVQGSLSKFISWIGYGIVSQWNSGLICIFIIMKETALLWCKKQMPWCNKVYLLPVYIVHLYSYTYCALIEWKSDWQHAVQHNVIQISLKNAGTDVRTKEAHTESNPIMPRKQQLSDLGQKKRIKMFWPHVKDELELWFSCLRCCHVVHLLIWLPRDVLEKI